MDYDENRGISMYQNSVIQAILAIYTEEEINDMLTINGVVTLSAIYDDYNGNIDYVVLDLYNRIRHTPNVPNRDMSKFKRLIAYLYRYIKNINYLVLQIYIYRKDANTYITHQIIDLFLKYHDKYSLCLIPWVHFEKLYRGASNEAWFRVTGVRNRFRCVYCGTTERTFPLKKVGETSGENCFDVVCPNHYRGGPSFGDLPIINKERTNCPICLGQDCTDLVLGCNHQYCEVCITRWLEDANRDTCPMCRTPVDVSQAKRIQPSSPM
jgi:glycosyltransferase involved in cell wall biosynthesis